MNSKSIIIQGEKNESETINQPPLNHNSKYLSIYYPTERKSYKPPIKLLNEA